MTETAMVPITVTAEQLDLVKRTVAEGATPEELELYLFDCKRQGVHPLDRLLHFTKRGGRYTPITSVDLMRTRAEATGECAGIDDPVFTYRGDEAAIPQTATDTVWRFVQGHRVPFTASARWAEYYPGEKQGYMWQKMPHTMLGKCAEALALRKAFPKQLQGLYAKEEMDQADRPEAPPRMTKSASARLIPEEDRSKSDEVSSLFLTAEDDERGDLIKEITRLSQKLKLKEEQRATYRKTYLGGSDPLDTSLDIVALRDLTDALLERAGEPKRKPLA